MPRRCPLPRCALLPFVAGLATIGCSGTAADRVPARAFHGDAAVAPVASPPAANAPDARTSLGDTVPLPAAAPSPTAETPAGAPTNAPAAAASAGAAPVAAVDTERAQRHELATAADPTAVALELAARLGSEERGDEALAVLDTALQRAPAMELRIARAGVYRDLGQRHRAVAELRAVRREAGPKALHPRLLFELAELEWLEGEGGAAAATLRELADVHAGDPWVEAAADARHQLAAEVASGKRPRRLTVRDLLGNLRGAPDATERLAVLDQLARGDGLPPAARLAVRTRAIAAALGDDSPAVRGRAVQLATLAPPDLLPFCRHALADAAPLVRTCAVGRCRELAATDATALLLGHLRDEPDGAVWRAAHTVLRDFHPHFAADGAEAPATPAERERRLAAWRALVTP